MNGDVCVRVRGVLMARLIDRCLAEGGTFARIRSVSPRETRIWTDEKNALALIARARQSGMDARIETTTGLTLFRQALKRRFSLPLAAALAFALFLTFASRVWRIDVQVENRTGDPVTSAEMAAIYDSLADAGIAVGMAKTAVDSHALPLSLRAGLEKYAFVGVKTTGVVLTVTAIAAYEPPEAIVLSNARDLVAQRDAVVLRLNVSSGQAAVAPGDTVRAGQVLIRGEERGWQETTDGVYAAGEVIARTWRTGEACVPTTRISKQYTGRESRSTSLRLGFLEFTVLHGTDYEQADFIEEEIPLVGLFFPFAQRTRRQVEYHLLPTARDPDAARLEARNAALRQALAQQPPGSKIADQWVQYEMSTDGIKARAVIEIHENIAVSRREGTQKIGNEQRN